MRYKMNGLCISVKKNLLIINTVRFNIILEFLGFILFIFECHFKVTDVFVTQNSAHILSIKIYVMASSSDYGLYIFFFPAVKSSCQKV